MPKVRAYLEAKLSKSPNLSIKEVIWNFFVLPTTYNVDILSERPLILIRKFFETFITVFFRLLG